MESLFQDIRFALRSLSKARGFTVTVVLLLAIGIGANTAMFSVVDAVFLRALPYRDADRLMLVHRSELTSDRLGSLLVPEFHAIKERARCFEDLVGVSDAWFNVLEGDTSEQRYVARVTVEYFRIFDAKPLLGRTFSPGDAEDDHLVVLSHRMWKESFGGDPGILGKLISLNLKPHRVIGVMPADYLATQWHEIWVLSELRPKDPTMWSDWVRPIGRLRPGVSAGAANQEIAAIGARLAEERPSKAAPKRYGVTSYHESLVKDPWRNVMMMIGAIVLVLVIACTNVASLFLARASARRAEIAIRLALGATPGRIVRQLLTEGALLALAAGALGLLLAAPAIAPLALGFTSRVAHAERAGIDARALGFTMAASLVTTLLFGLLPALQASRWDVHAALKEGGLRATASKRANLVRSGLVAAQIALAVVLVAGAGVLGRSLARLANVDRGFDTRGVAAFCAIPPKERYGTPERRAAFYEAAVSKLEALPGVEAAGVTWEFPTLGGTTDLLEIEGRPPFRRGSGLVVRPNAATPDYARAIGLPLLEGRFIEARDVLGSTPVIVVNKTMADRLFPGESPIGHRIRSRWDEVEEREDFAEIVGVVGDMRSNSLREPPVLETFVPLAQHPSDNGGQFAVRVSFPVTSAYPIFQRAMREVDPFAPISKFHIGKDLKDTLESYVMHEVEPLRFAVGLSAVLGTIALLLAALGVFGVVSYSVEQRWQEFAIRLALGAVPRDILLLVLKRSALLVGIGVAVGLGAAFFAMRLLGALVFDVSPIDPPSLAIAVLVLVATALLASYLPARRATRITPMTALRDL